VSRISLPVKKHDKGEWAEISSLGPSLPYVIVGEEVHCIKDKYSFAGGHRVRKYKFQKNVHFCLPAGTPLDISAVPAGTQPPRRQPPQR
jgi:hypothetical protein